MRRAAVLALVLLAAGCSSITAGTGHGSARPTSTAATSPSPTSAPPTHPTSLTSPPSTPTTSASSSSGGAATTQIVLRPVTSDGSPASGWTVRDESLSIDCAGDEASPVAVDPGIAYCSPSAAFAVACWPADPGHALCAVDLAKRILLRYRLAGSFGSHAAPARQLPFTLRLATGASCTIRVGGTGINLTDHPDWVQFYFCDDHTAVYGPATGTGVNSAAAVWTVAVASTDGEGAVTTVPVATATFVGTASG